MPHTAIFASLVVAAAPMLAMLFFIWWLDRYDREPLGHVFLSFLWGAIGAFILSVIGSSIGLQFFGDLSPEAELVTLSVIVAPVIEELMKGLILFFLIRQRSFGNVIDGLVYGAASGLGFGMTENFFYFMMHAGTSSLEEWLNLLFVRSLFTAYMHCAATATFGAGISRLKNGGPHAIRSMVIFYFIAVGLHAGWNYLLTVGSREAEGWAFLILLVYFVAIFILFALSILRESKEREKVLEDEFASGILPSQFKDVLFSYRRIRGNDWFPSLLDKENYLSLVGRLSMCKRDYGRANERRRQVLDEEIKEIRRELKRFCELITQISK